MKRFFPVILLTAFSLSTFTGCVFSKKSAKPKEPPATVGDMEHGFKQRWVEKRAAELQARGLATEAAHGQATEEFRTRYGYTKAAQP